MMRCCTLIMVVSCLSCLSCLSGCKAYDEPAGEEENRGVVSREQAQERETSFQVSGDDPVPPPRRLLVLRLAGDELELLSSTPMDPVSGRGRGAYGKTRLPPGWNGRYNVTDCRGRTLAQGAFRMPPSRVHALFDEVDGPAGPGSAPLDEVVLWMRVDAPGSACRVELWDSDRYLGRVEL